MKLSSLKPLLLFSALFITASGETLLAAGPGQQATTLAQPKAFPGRPANVPSEFVATPFGYFHPSCVHTLSPQDIQLLDGRVQHANGIVEGGTSCNYPRYAKDGSEVKSGSGKHQGGSDSGKTPVNVSAGGDAEVTSDSDEHPFGGLHGFWTVPDAPRANDGQILYYWQGLEDAASGESVLQPVMSGYGNGLWTISSYNCCMENNTYQSQYVVVSPGDVIYASITSNCAAGTVSCPTWNVLIVDVTTGQSSLLANTPSFGQSFSWAFGAYLEPYASSCADYPRDGHLHFWDVTLLDMNLKPIRDPGWKGYWGTPSSCPFKVKIDDPKNITLFY